MKDYREVWEDMTRQRDNWDDDGCTRLYTGFGGPHKGNASVSKQDFITLQKQWRDLGGPLRRYFGTAASGSGYTENDIVDFKCHPFGKDRDVFVYHLKVPGIASDTRISPA